MPARGSGFNLLRLIVSCVLGTCLCDGTTSGADQNLFLPEGIEDPGWPHLRGPNLDGRSPEIGLAEEWPEAGPPVLWSRELGQGYSGFTAAGNRVYTQYQNLGGQYVLCLDAQTGEKIWEYRYDWPFEAAGVYPGPRSTPTIAGKRIIFCGPSGLTGCLDAASGDLLWDCNPKEIYRGKGTDFGYSISPTLFEGQVLLPVGGQGAGLVVLDLESGAELWRAGDEPASYVPAYPVQIEGQTLLVTFMENTLSAYDPVQQKQAWSVFLSQGYDEHAAWPIYSEPYLMTCSPFRDGFKLYRLTGGNEPAVEEVLRNQIMSNDVFSSVLIDGAVYGFDVKDAQAKTHRTTRGMLRCIDFLTGEQYWETDAVDHCAVLEADGKLILWTDLGELVLARCTREKYDELDRYQILGNEICWTQPILHQGRLYVRNQSRAVCLFLGEPDRLELDENQVLLTAQDISTEPYRDWTFLLAVEPEYAFDLPTWEWFRNWYFYSLMLVLPLAGLGVAALYCLVRFSVPSAWWTFWILALLCGAAGTTILGTWRQDFIFTWPVCVFVGFQAWVYQSAWGRAGKVTRPRLKAYLTAAFFLSICFGYYLICKRLSLVFEWTFLTGILPAFPVAVLGARFTHRTRDWFWGIGWTVAAFSAYYWSSVLLLMFKY